MAKVVGNKIGVKVLFAFLCFFTANAQKVDTLSTSPKTNGPLLGQLIINGDTVAWSVLDEVLFVAKPTLNDVQARRNYYALMKKVGRVYPYVREAALRMDSVNMQLEGIDRKRQRRKYTKSYQKYLEERFEPELRKLTRSEGQILSKLVFRETNTSVYEIIKTYRNGLSARFWSMTAWWYDIDLKRPYDPENDAEDRLIENILLRKFIAGELVPARAEERILYQR
jgi:hypothetical protein